MAAERSRTAYAHAEVPVLTGDISTHTWQENGRDRRSRYARFAVTTMHTDRPTDDQPIELKAQVSDQWGCGSHQHLPRRLDPNLGRHLAPGRRALPLAHLPARPGVPELDRDRTRRAAHSRRIGVDIPAAWEH